MQKSIPEFFGEKVFNLKNMRNYLSEKAYQSLRSTMYAGRTIDPAIADEVADAMKSWAVQRGATHYTHWFQPLTGATAEKHDSFLSLDSEGDVIMKFSGQELIRGEPDASSLPSGGLRATFEARGYTGWDPTSPAFIKETENGGTLCIPTVFYGYHGEALDKKIPLLRSMEALSKQIKRLGAFFGIEGNSERAYVTLGTEQEYFLIDRELYAQRLDLFQTGRTLFGCAPAKHQQLSDHYFGAIKPRVLAFMTDLDRELWSLGIPVMTRHNEVCPAQFEIAPLFEELNLAVDHNMILMDIIQKVAEQHDFICLLHEKPYNGVNGSGKHNNWSICGPDGKNWLTPGDNPHENAKFLTLICALMKAVDTHADILRASVATAGNDHRLGANEAPPAIVSIFLGEQLTDIIDQIETGEPKRAKEGKVLELGVSSLPSLPRDTTDRNRTSPFAFTGNKFEFRAVGSNQNCAGPNVVLNTIVTEALDYICSRLETDKTAGKEFTASLHSILKAIITKHKRILYNGDNYTKKWRKEAEKRGLPNLKNSQEALKVLTKEKTVSLFSSYNVLSRAELTSRYEVYRESYDEEISIEAKCALQMARTMITPAVLSYQNELSQTVSNTKKAGLTTGKLTKQLLSDVSTEIEAMLQAAEDLESTIENGASLEKLKAMDTLRTSVDRLETMMPQRSWPLPSYTEMLFRL